MKITLGGPPGAGKGTVGRLLAAHYGYEFISGGDLFRKAAAARGMTMEAFDAYMKEHPEARVDHEIDGLQVDIGKHQDNFILESRLAWHFVPHSIKIKIDGELDERIRRIANVSSVDRIAYTQDDFEETKRKTLKRFNDHQEKIKEIYGIADLVADEHFDIVIDSTGVSPEGVAQKTITAIEAFLVQHPECR
ncbi:MAG: nucleoside monophosphate kinase [Candidatus Pacebacteria bacterium]|nr:nucleoside monophosphate kinase [Candidatus Paceibacterota bacterium]